jgi:hypothetical protein
VTLVVQENCEGLGGNINTEECRDSYYRLVNRMVKSKRRENEVSSHVS